MERYNFNLIEKKWQKHWHDNNVFKSKIDQNKKKFQFVENDPQ